MSKVISDDKFYELVECVYAAAHAPTEWQAFLDKFVAAIPGTNVVILLRSLSADTGVQAVHANFPKGAIEDYLKNHADSAPWISIARVVASGVPFSTEDYCPLSSIEHTPFYKNFLKPYGIGGGFGVKLWDQADGRALILATCPFERMNELKPGMLALMGKLTPHLQRSLALRWELKRERARGLEEGLVRQVNPVFILNDRREVMFMNAAAHKARDEGIVDVDKVSRLFRLISQNDNDAIDKLLDTQKSGANPKHVSPRKLMSFSVAGSANPNALEILALPSALEGSVKDIFSDGSKEPRLLVILRLRGGIQPPTVEDVRTVLGLSPREADVAVGLAEGRAPEELARVLDVSVDTIRWHLKNIYQRIGCSSQAELVRTLLSLVGPARLG